MLQSRVAPEIEDPAKIILEAELRLSSPERVYTWLEARAAKIEHREYPVPQDIENALLARKEVLIDLGLARFGTQRDTLQTLFARYGGARKPVSEGVPLILDDDDSAFQTAVRIAVLSNESVQTLIHPIPVTLLGLNSTPEDVTHFMSRLSLEELTALFTNPTIDDSFVRQFIAQQEPWQALDDERRRVCLLALAQNALRDGQQQSCRVGVWRLAQNLPPTKAWAEVLCRLCENITPDAPTLLSRISSSVSREDVPLKVAVRWFPDPADAEQVASEAEAIASGYLGPYASVRYALARIAVSRGNLALFVKDPDPAVRAAAYREDVLGSDEIKAADARDPKLAFRFLVANQSLWMTKESREALRALTLTKEPEDDDAEWRYQRARDAMIREHPQWFRDEVEDKPEESLSDIAARLDEMKNLIKNFRTPLGELVVLSSVTCIAAMLTLAGVAGAHYPSWLQGWLAPVAVGAAGVWLFISLRLFLGKGNFPAWTRPQIRSPKPATRARCAPSDRLFRLR
jgi:hypothetical protein